MATIKFTIAFILMLILGVELSYLTIGLVDLIIENDALTVFTAIFGTMAIMVVTLTTGFNKLELS